MLDAFMAMPSPFQFVSLSRGMRAGAPLSDPLVTKTLS